MRFFLGGAAAGPGHCAADKVKSGLMTPTGKRALPLVAQECPV